MSSPMGRVTVTVGGQTTVVQPIAADMVQWERYARNNKIPLALDSPDFPRITHIAFLAYAAGKRAGEWSQPFDSWLEAFEAVEADSDADAEGK